MTQPLVTVYFLTYNRPHLFPEALFSIQNQTFQDYQVLVIDNGSTPPITLPDEIARDPRFRYLRIDDNALGRPISLDILSSITTRYTAYLFDDDRWAPDKLEKQVAYLENAPETVACFTYARLIDEFGRHLVNAEASNPFGVPNRSRGEWVRQFFLRGNCLCQPSILVRAEALAHSMPPMPYIQLPDLAQWVNLLAHGNIHVIEEPLTLFNWATDGSNESAINTRASSNRLNYEHSRIYHQFLALPHGVLCEAFGLPPEATEEDVRIAMFHGAVSCADEPHFRFAAELAEERFAHHYRNGDHATAAFWGQCFRTGASQSIDSAPATAPQTRHVAPADKRYQTWLAQRQLLETDGLFCTAPAGDTLPVFHIVLRLFHGEEHLLANTLDSLGGQIYPHWHLDIVSPMPSPAGIDEIPCVGWHSLDAASRAKETIDGLVAAAQHDWILELPPGAVLDQLYLWRLSKEGEDNAALAFFSDDDCYAETCERHTPRFKPGCNPLRMQASDLAGPVAMRANAWQSIGGASPLDNSPWFQQLLRLAQHFGWSAIRHIDDVLISYPNSFPHHVDSCQAALNEYLVACGQQARFLPVGDDCWNISYQHALLPPVTVAVLSRGQVDLLTRCIDSIAQKTAYPTIELLVVCQDSTADPELPVYLEELRKKHVRVTVAPHTPGNHAARCNLAMRTATHDLVVLIQEEVVILHEEWLTELVRLGNLSEFGAVSPRMYTPGAPAITSAGAVLGLEGTVGSPFARSTKLNDTTYQHCIHLARDVSALANGMFLVKKASYQQVDGMDDDELGDHLCEVDLAIKLRQIGLRIAFQPRATVAFSGTSLTPDQQVESGRAGMALQRAAAEDALLKRWGRQALVDPYWNNNMSRRESALRIETEFRPQWQYLPSPAPRFLVRTLNNGQGHFRITAPLRALRTVGRASECIWHQEGTRNPSPAELLALDPDTLIVQHYVQDPHLSALNQWHRLPDRPFIVFAADDLLTNLPESNPLRRNIPPNSRASLKYALDRCDRMVVSTEFLAESYRGFIKDIRVVPNCLEQKVWLPLHSRKRTGKRPRIGWAGGSTHQGDLILLKEVIEKTRGEADWIFFGMCPEEIRPLLSEYHPLYPFHEYPARLAALNLDLAVAPLADHPFNRGKSNLRLLEYGILGIPVVCTDIDPYRNSPACCVPNTSHAWVEAVRARISDADARDQEGREMKSWVQRHFLLENNLDQWLAAHTR